MFVRLSDRAQTERVLLVSRRRLGFMCTYCISKKKIEHGCQHTQCITTLKLSRHPLNASNNHTGQHHHIYLINNIVIQSHFQNKLIFAVCGQVLLSP